jgi:hypothetical protein
MNEEQTTTLTPSLARAFVRVFLTLLLLITIVAIIERYDTGRWWNPDYFVSFAIPLVVGPIAVCLMFVPRRIRWSATEFQIQPKFGSVQTLPWTLLYAYGPAYNVFLLQFTGVNTFQIFAGAFRRDEWRAFRSFLKTNHADKKAHIWLGPKAIRWNRKSKPSAS